MIIPSIDIAGGRAVQLKQGAEHLLTSPRDPVDLARDFARYGPVAVVDLDAARETGDNRDVVAACCRAAPCRVGGGIRSADRVRAWIKAGAEKVVIGTAASPELLQKFPPDWLIVALDALGRDVVDHGWTRSSGCDVLERARELAPYCGEFLFTQVQREGMLAGPDLETAAALREQTDRPITLAGGIRNAEDIAAIEALGMNAQIGRAIYEGSLNLTEAFVAQIRFDANGLVPTVVQSAADRQILMLAYSSAESLRQALNEGRGWYCSRSRGSLWRKGETSGHTQRLLRARYDCDRDTVLFVVEQTGPACHTNAYACFGVAGPPAPPTTSPEAILTALEQTLRRRKSSVADRGVTDPPTPSYTQQLLGDPGRLAAKLREEIEEVITAPDRDNLTWECADVLYHLLVKMTADGVLLRDVANELRSRFRA